MSENRVTRFTTKDGLVQDFINSLSEDKDGGIWICTNGGLSCFKNEKFRNFTTHDGLSNNYCFFAIEDDNRDLWIGTVNGINRISGIHKDTFKINASMRDLVSAEINEAPALIDKGGHLWFGSINGVTRFNPHYFRKHSTPPPIYIDYLNIFDDKIPLAGDNTGSNTGRNTLRFTYNRNYMKFGFIGLSFISPSEIKYRYRLKGFDKKWTLSKNRSVYYANLPPGDYAFEVTAKSSQGLESIQPAILPFKILPPFWERWWFRLTVVLGMLFFLLTIFRWRSKRVKEKTILKERNKQLVMAQKMELLGMLAGGAVHDLKNLLTTIFNYSGMVSRMGDMGEKQSKAIERIQKATETAIQLSKQILSFTRKTGERNRMVILTDLLDDIIEILTITMPKKVSLHLEKPQLSIKIRMLPSHFQQVVMNLCINALHAMPGGGIIKILLHTQENKVILEVSDTGTGMDETTRQRIFDPLYSTKESEKGTGLGLFVVKQIVELYKGKINVNTSLGKGTTFIIYFPSGDD
ncbi:MAG: GHKL domain-containing protein [bacterium]|nr:GHKL domain-containing protein [bacterium]